MIAFAFMLVSNNVSAVENNETEATIGETNLESLENVVITDENLNSVLSDDLIPLGVRNRIEELNSTIGDNGTITLYMPIYKNSPNARVTENIGWSSYRTYNGFQMRDYVIKTTNSYSLVDILPRDSGTYLGDFAVDILVYGGTTLLDSLIPFFSDGMTLIELIFGVGSSNTVTATSGDKAQAAPTYTTYEYQTYVTYGGSEILGATTYRSILEKIEWRLYSDDLHDSYYKFVNYNKTLYSENYNNRDASAYNSLYTMIPNGDYPITIKIGSKNFLL
ncbi:MAG: hypothetical protein MSA01_05720 [Anaeromassilibacillus sp.]|nr:hypothetical protein [Anaeromassilibacillus sp.]MDY3779584.1 hypothetical protein [Candidatus Limousia pullorum]